MPQSWLTLPKNGFGNLFAGENSIKFLFLELNSLMDAMIAEILLAL